MKTTTYFRIDERKYPHLFKAIIETNKRKADDFYRTEYVDFLWNIHITNEKTETFYKLFVSKEIRVSITFLENMLLKNNGPALLDFFKMKTTEHKYTGEYEDEDVDG